MSRKPGFTVKMRSANDAFVLEPNERANVGTSVEVRVAPDRNELLKKDKKSEVVDYVKNNIMSYERDDPSEVAFDDKQGQKMRKVAAEILKNGKVVAFADL